MVAELRAPTVRETAESELGPLYELVQAGALSRGLPHDGSLYGASKLKAAAGTASALIELLREDRFSTERAPASEDES